MRAAGVELDALCFPQTQMCRAFSLIIGCYGRTSEQFNQFNNFNNRNHHKTILHQFYTKPRPIGWSSRTLPPQIFPPTIPKTETPGQCVPTVAVAVSLHFACPERNGDCNSVITQ